MRALTVLAGASLDLVNDQLSEDPAGDIARAEKAIDAALALQPESSSAHHVKGFLYFAKQQWGPMVTEAETAIALDPNNANPHELVGVGKMFLGHSRGRLRRRRNRASFKPAGSARSLVAILDVRLPQGSPQWEQAIPWCDKAVAGLPQAFIPLLFLASANAWAGHDKEAKDAAAQLQKVYPGFTVQTWAGIHWSDNPTFNAGNQRVIEGLRKAGLPEGEKKTN